VVVAGHKGAAMTAQKVQVSPFVGLQHMVNIEFPVA
jgi:hypothetical protein